MRLTAKLQEATGDLLPGYEVFVEPVKEHRFVLVIRGEGLGGDLSETDPLVTGKKPLMVEDASGTPEGAHTAELVNKWVDAARAALADEERGEQPQPARPGEGSRVCRVSRTCTGCGRRRSPCIPCTKVSPAWWAWSSGL